MTAQLVSTECVYWSGNGPCCRCCSCCFCPGCNYELCCLDALIWTTSISLLIGHRTVWPGHSSAGRPRSVSIQHLHSFSIKQCRPVFNLLTNLYSLLYYNYTIWIIGKCSCLERSVSQVLIFFIYSYRNKTFGNKTWCIFVSTELKARKIRRGNESNRIRPHIQSALKSTLVEVCGGELRQTNTAGWFTAEEGGE